MKTYTRILNIVFCGLIVWMIIPSCFCQDNDSDFLYNRNGNKIVFNKIEGVLHVKFLEGTTISTKNEVLNELSDIVSYTMFPDSSYRFIVAQQSSDSFKAKLLRNSCVSYCQNEYCDTLGGVVWGTNRIMVKMKPNYSIGNLIQTLNIQNVQQESKWYDTTIFALVLPKDSNLFVFSDRIFESGMVEYAQPAFFHYVTLDGYDSNPEFGTQWNLKDTVEDVGDEWSPTTYKYGINAIRAWKFTSGSPGIRIAVLDDGVFGNHEDLLDNFLLERNYTDILNIESMIDPREHGTQCAGVISAVNNNKGLIGVAHGCKLASFIVLAYSHSRDSNHPSLEDPVFTHFSDELFEESIHYACDTADIAVLSCSWHLNGLLTETYLSAINYATLYGRHGKGCVFVFSSGNRNDSTETDVINPTTNLPNVLSVGGSTTHGYRVSQSPFWNDPFPTWESSYGDSLDLMAPGYDITTTCYDGNNCYTSFEGTSAAAPHVAGVAALVLSVDTNLTYRQVFEILCSSATKVNDDYYDYEYRSQYPYGTWNNEMGYGLVNAHHAVLKTLYRDYYVTGISEIGLCETGSYHAHGTTPFNDSITCGWSSSPNIEILSTTDSLIARGTRPGPGWVAFNIIHDNDSLPLVFPVNVTNGGITVLSNHEFTGNTTLSSPHFTDADLIIDSLATLTITDTLYVAGGSSIIVRPGGKLIVNGGTLTNACDGEMWQGIIVEGNANIRQAALAQGSVILTNATIENARDAISTRGADNNAVFEHTGGIIQATNTLFRNNRRSVAFLSYENHTTGGAVTDNASYFTRCTFTVDNGNLFAANDVTFKNHVSMWHVRGVKFNGCAFRNETGSHSGKAIYTIGAGFTARRVCPMPTIEPCVCNNYGTDTVRRCLFVGFDTAVHATNTEGSYLVTLDNCDFADNYIGVELAAADNARVSFCDIDLSGSTPLHGLYLKNSTGYTVESNSFHSEPCGNSPSATGIRVVHSGTAENVIRKNVFRNLMYGCLAQDTNATPGFVKPQYGLQFQCNDFLNCAYDIAVDNGRIRNPQGSASAGADNDFRNEIYGSFLLSNAGSFTYWYSNTGYHAPYNAPTPGVTLKNTAAANSCASTLCGDIPLYPRGTAALSQYRAMAEEYAALLADVRMTDARGASLQMDETSGNSDNDLPTGDDAALIGRLSDLSAQMGDLARAGIRNILNDSVLDMALLKEWYSAVTAAAPATGDIPVAAYQLAETYSMEGDLAAAAALLASLPQQFTPDEAARSEYANYMALQQLRETVAGNWYAMTDTDIAAMRQVAEYDNGRAARMAKEILCFFHHICYEDDLLLELDGIGERNLQGGRTRCVPTDNGLTIYPNPATHTLTVETTNPIHILTVYDLAGRVMMTADGGTVETYHGASLQVDVSSLPNGIYLLRAVTDSGVETGRFVKN